MTEDCKIIKMKLQQVTEEAYSHQNNIQHLFTFLYFWGSFSPSWRYYYFLPLRLVKNGRALHCIKTVFQTQHCKCLTIEYQLCSDFVFLHRPKKPSIVYSDPGIPACQPNQNYFSVSTGLTLFFYTWIGQLKHFFETTFILTFFLKNHYFNNFNYLK